LRGDEHTRHENNLLYINVFFLANFLYHAVDFHLEDREWNQAVAWCVTESVEITPTYMHGNKLEKGADEQTNDKE
jgi:hypothetical protein